MTEGPTVPRARTTRECRHEQRWWDRVDAATLRRVRNAQRIDPRLVAVLIARLLGVVGAVPADAVHDDNLFELGGVQAADILGDGNAANGPD
jgi:hypothetical protein